METKKNISRRDFLKLGASSASALFLASCATSEEPAVEEAPGEEVAVEPAAEPMELNFLSWGDIVDTPVWTMLGDLYHERNPNVTVNITPVPDPGGGNFYAKLRTMIAGGDTPHVASAQGWEWQPFSDDGVLAPLDDWINLENFTAPYPDGVKAIEDSTIRDGKRYLIPLQIGMMLMFYVKKFFDDAGLPYPTEDWTVEEFLATAEALTDTSGDTKKFGYQANNLYARDIHWIMTSGVREFDKLIDPTKAQFNQPEIAEMLQLMVSDVFNNPKVSPTPADLEGGSNSLDTGNVAMKYEGPWFFGRLDNEELRADGKEIDFDVVMMPKGADSSRKHRGWSEGVVVPASDNPEAGWGFAKFMGDEEGNKLFCQETGRVPNNPALVESWWIPTIKEKFGVDNGDQWLKIINNLEVDVIGISRASIWNECAKPVAWDPMVTGEKTAAEVLPELDACVQALLDDL